MMNCSTLGVVWLSIMQLYIILKRLISINIYLPRIIYIYNIEVLTWSNKNQDRYRKNDDQICHEKIDIDTMN